MSIYFFFFFSKSNISEVTVLTKMCRRHAKSGEAAQRRHCSRAAKNPPALEENPHPGGGNIQVEPLLFTQACFIDAHTDCCRTPIGSLL